MKLLTWLTLVCVLGVSVASNRRRSASRRREQQVSKCEVTLGNSGVINGVQACANAPDDPSKYANLADWNFRYSNRQASSLWLNIQYETDIEDNVDEGCVRDSLTFGDASDPQRLVLCGKRSGAVSFLVRPGGTFTIHFKSDYSVAGTGFKLAYSVGRQQAYATFNEARTLSDAEATRSTIAPTPRLFLGEDFTEYAYPEYPDYNHFYYTYPAYYQYQDSFNPRVAQDYPTTTKTGSYNPSYRWYPTKTSDYYYTSYKGYPTQTHANYYLQLQESPVKTASDYGQYGRVDPSPYSQYWKQSLQNQYNYQRWRREAQH